AINFLVFMGFHSGVSVFIADLVGKAGDLLLSLALYIFIGMLLKESRIPQLALNIIRPWKMSSELLCFIVLLIAAVPTAYTGASGIFIIAAGAIIFEEIRMANTRGQLALATTAMSGSMGVVLKPCLLIVIIASLNDEVTTNELFTTGAYVFLISAFLFFVITQLTRQEPISIAPVSEAFPKSLAALIPLLPYVIITAGVILLYSYVFDQNFDEFSAPIILPIVMLTILFYEKVFSNDVSDAMDSELNTNFDSIHDEVDSHLSAKTTEQAYRFASTETTNHIGALLFLMFFTAALGGLIEHSDLINSFPSDFNSFWGMLGIVVVTLVVIGMFMEPYGAVILVNAVIAPVAFANGINPLHFWLITLVAFELGYLSPPVALNHLLTRHVIGEENAAIARAEPLPRDNFWFRYERFLLPIVVMGLSLILVAFVPPLVGYDLFF
ncbi:MAG: TRAP transporter large permease subunit, partial [Pseudomonadota bacterium]|nr:TRAP transporter large permease subunit [Pseudomonadota bacterium]